MDTDYDRIAEQYQRARYQPWRTHIELYTAIRVVGDLAGKAVIDLACGEGHYTRALRQQGAADRRRGPVAHDDRFGRGRGGAAAAGN